MSAAPQPGNTSADALPLRIATVGLSPTAMFHLEAAAIRSELIPVAAASSVDEESSVEPVPGCLVCSIDELVARSDIEAVFVCGSIDDRVEIAIRLLQSDKHVIFEPSWDLQAEGIERLITTTKTSRKFCDVWRPYNADSDFRRAAKVVEAGEAGPARSARFIQHDISAALLPGAGSRDQFTESTLRDLVGHRIAQATKLINEPIKTITTNIRRESIQFGEREPFHKVTPNGNTSFHAVIEFENEATAVIDIGLACPAPYSTGWIVQGDKGGYHSERQYITVDDGEIYDVAVDVEPFDPYLNLYSQVTNWGGQSAKDESLERLQSEFQLAELLHKIQ